MGVSQTPWRLPALHLSMEKKRDGDAWRRSTRPGGEALAMAEENSRRKELKIECSR
jgi:hypothetical protein